MYNIYIYTLYTFIYIYNKQEHEGRRKHNFLIKFNTSVAHQIKNPLRTTSEYIAIIYFQTFT